MRHTYGGAMADRHVVLYRSLNLGHRGSPDRRTLETALIGAGARRARSFQTNGTVLVETDRPRQVVTRAAQTLYEAAAYRDTAFVRPLDLLSELVAGSPFAADDDEHVYRETFTFVEDGAFDVELPWTNAKGNFDVVAARHGVLLGVVRMLGTIAGDPTAELERLTATAATTRTRGTIERLVAAARGW